MHFFTYQIHKKLLLVSALILFCFWKSVAQSLPINKLYERESVIPASLQYLIDTTNHLSFDQVKKIPQTNWNHINAEQFLNLGYTKEVVWMQLNVQNVTTGFNNWILHLKYTLLDSIHVYLPQPSGGWKEIQTGRGIPFHSRGNIKSADFAFTLNLPTNNPQSIFVRIHTKGPLNAPFLFKQQTVFQQDMMNSHIYYGIYFGALAVMIFYNLFIFIALRNVNYLYYILSILCTVGIFMTVAGYSFKYLFPESVWLNLYFTRIFMGFVVLATGMFALNFLEVKKYIKWGDYLLKGVMIAAVFATVLVVTDISPSATNSVVSLHSISLLVVGIVVWHKGNASARFYVFAWAFYLLGGSLITLRNAGILPLNPLTTHGAEIGSLLEVILLSFALSDRYRSIKKEKEALQAKNLRIQQKHNEELEKKVEERTKELSSTNDALNLINETLNTTIATVKEQKEQISAQHQDITKQSKQLEDAFSNIRSSINYARRIQEAKLPQLAQINAAFPQSFVFFKPRDHVSGDFYWFADIGEKKIIAAVDCTGHGVPGAFMSMIGSELLNEVVNQRKVFQPDEILKHLHLGIRRTLRQRETANRDGMDIAICVWDQNKNTLQFAGAKSPMLLMNNNKLQVVKGDRMPIGGLQREVERCFTVHEFNIESPSTVYIYSDGFQDQFGGENGKKFLSKKFKQLLFENHELPMEDQQQLLTHTFEKWISSDSHTPETQIDDVLVIGFRIVPVGIAVEE